MAALAPPPFRPSPPLPASSSSSTTSSAAPSKKQENSAAVAAGRRRLEEFKKRKAAEKGKKTASAAPTAHQAVQNVAAEPESVAALPAADGDASVSATRPVDSNGHLSKDSLQNGLNVVSKQASLPTSTVAVAVAPIIQTMASPIFDAAHKQAEELLRKETQAQPRASKEGSGMDRSRPVEIDANVLRPAAIPSSSGSFLGKPGVAAGVLGGLDTSTDALRTTTTSVQTQAPPLGAAKPLYKPAPPPVRPPGNFGIVPPPTTTSGSDGGRLEPAKNAAGMSRPPFSLPFPPPQIHESILNPSSSEKVGTAETLVKLDTNFGGPSRSAHEAIPLRTNSSSSSAEQRESASSFSFSSAKPMFTAAAEGPPPSREGTTINNQIGEVSSSASSPANLHNNQQEYASNLNAEIGKGSLQPVRGTSISSSTLPLPSSFDIKLAPKASEAFSAFSFRPLSETATASKSLPFPPPLFRPPPSPSSFKHPPFPSSTGFSTSLESTTSSTSTSSSSTAPTPNTTTTNFLDNATIPPSILKVPSRLPTTVDSLSENGIPEVSADSFKPILPRLIPALSDLSTAPVRKVDSPRRLWSPAASGGDDFAMLEQHIEDLTQDKFSLQRGLEAALRTQEILAQENSAMTEDYNKQGGLVNGLKAETERQQGEIRAQVVVVKKMKAERDKAIQDSSAAVERSKALAAEAVELEEKVLRARSQELKLQREMESLSTETESHKRQISSLDKDRANLKTLMDALQEEKSVLQTQIRKSAVAASSGVSGRPSGRFSAAGPNAPAKADASTSTDNFDQGISMDLGSVATGVPRSTALGQFMGLQPLEPQNRLPVILSSVPSRPLLSPSHGPIASGSLLVPNIGGLASSQPFSPRPSGLSGRGVNLGPMSSVIPPDQAATIRNINGLITELGEEKEALMKALKAESVGAAELRALNAELSQKLEGQTQRLELAVAQSMAYDSTPRVGGNYAVSWVAPEYVDEGDEVVERVLGWIMQLFPSGSSRRKRL